jgi:uncharacterized protein
MKIKLDIIGLSNSQSQSGAYALILTESEGKRRLPIIIGAFEAQSIALELEGLKPPRPLTHDLFLLFANAFEIQLIEVFIYKLEDGVFFSMLVCRQNDHEIEIDARTSDAVALAIRFKSPIYTSPEILDKSGIILESEPEKEELKAPKKSTSKPKNKLQTKSLEELQKLLEDAIANEDYETASLINDEIKRREK